MTHLTHKASRNPSEYVPAKQEGEAALQAYIEHAITVLREHGKLFDAMAFRDQSLALQNARVDLTPEGQRLRWGRKVHTGSISRC
jgi:hypothetical protein